MSQNRDAPAYQEYAASVLANLSFRTMSLQDRGLLYTMRLECWVNSRLPQNEDRLAKVLSVQASELVNSLPTVMPFFKAVGDFLVCPELDNYRAHLADRKKKQSQGGIQGSATVNRRRRPSETLTEDGNSSTLPSTSSSILPGISQPTRRGTRDSSVQSSSAKPSQIRLPEKAPVNDPFVSEYEEAERCAADDYAQASGR